MENGKNRGIGHNSKINKSDFKSLNPVDPEFLQTIKSLCKDIYTYIQHANNEHRASHGDEYYFESVIDTYDNLRKIIDCYPSGTLFYVDYYYTSSW